MRLDIEKIQSMVDEGKRLKLAQDFSYNGTLLIGQDKVLSQQDIKRLGDKVRGKLEIRMAGEALVSHKIRQSLTSEIKSIFSEHNYYKNLGTAKRKKIEKIIENTISNNEYICYALQHIHQFSNELFYHSVHVALLSLIVDLAWQRRHNQGLIDGGKLENILFGALLHDIGYLTMDKGVWEVKRMDKNPAEPNYKSHPTKGYELLKRDQVKHGYSKEILNIVLQHEERVNESGFPMGLMRNQIDLNAQIVGLCNDFEHLLNGQLAGQLKDFLQISQYLIGRKDNYDKNCLNVLIEEFRYMD